MSKYWQVFENKKYVFNSELYGKTTRKYILFLVDKKVNLNMNICQNLL